MERLRKTARVLDVVARIAFWFTMVVGALLFLLWALNLRDPFFTSYMGGLLMAGNLNFTLAEPVNFPWGAMLVLAALELAVYGCTVQIFRRVLRPMKEGRPFDGAARQLRRLAWVTLAANLVLSLGEYLVQLPGAGPPGLPQRAGPLLRVPGGAGPGVPGAGHLPSAAVLRLPLRRGAAAAGG